MASNIVEVQLKYIVFVRCEAVIFEVLKACVYLAMVYLLVLCACFFAICTAIRVSCSCSSTCLTKTRRVSQGCPGRTDGNLALLRNSKDKKCWAKAVSEENTHIHFTFFQLSWTSLATDILFWSSSHCFFFVFFFLPLDTNRLRGESSFRPEPLRKPPYEPSRVDIQFYYNFKKIYTDIPLELPKDDQVLLLQGFNDVLSPKRDDGKRFSSTSENLKFGSPDQKSRRCTCAQACYSPF